MRAELEIMEKADEALELENLCSLSTGRDNNLPVSPLQKPTSSKSTNNVLQCSAQTSRCEKLPETKSPAYDELLSIGVSDTTNNCGSSMSPLSGRAAGYRPATSAPSIPANKKQGIDPIIFNSRRVLNPISGMNILPATTNQKELSTLKNSLSKSRMVLRKYGTALKSNFPGLMDPLWDNYDIWFMRVYVLQIYILIIFGFLYALTISNNMKGKGVLYALDRIPDNLVNYAFFSQQLKIE
ncbi:LANO_0D01090g1_1 [Lachancea nothofagi CBS 11611]|uniref:LANO_0D01090g1_1 n=1 Tax=Lachancea nothofagi CBS 11611 TaxID=1266666 RepID=A0A1G4JD51_9SACH|nr:LANO_0D01090g1_1 [Lachancea nothofagi CBS 11611]